MTLTVQDPAEPVGNANSYLDLASARALAAQYVITLPADDTEAEATLIQSFRYLQGRECEMQGERTTEAQNSAYPRTGVVIRGVDIADNVFPGDLLMCQLLGAQAFGEGVALFGKATDGREVASQAVSGAVSRSFFESGNDGSVITYPQFESAFKPLAGGGNYWAQPIGGQLWGGRNHGNW